MYLTIIFGIGILIVLIAVYNDYKWRSCLDEYFIAAIGIIFMGAIAYGTTLGVARGVYAREHNLNTYEYRDLPIVSLQNGESWSMGGTFFLGIGGVSGGSSTHYITYGKFSQGLKKLELSDTHYYIKETDSKKPCIPNYWRIVVRKPFKSKWLWNREYSKNEYMRENYDAWTIVVPKNTVYKEFKVQY